mmetsp:Transcript_102634/g.219522  ORF Transcript_102634/g.219522 Transcript_102634/m.219522 type:complete len:267 (+) Transcript_102634:675-1475(+)
MLANVWRATASKWPSPTSWNSTNASFAAMRASMSRLVGTAFCSCLLFAFEIISFWRSAQLSWACSMRVLAMVRCCIPSSRLSPDFFALSSSSFAAFRTSLNSFLANRMLVTACDAVAAARVSPRDARMALAASAVFCASSFFSMAMCTSVIASMAVTSARFSPAFWNQVCASLAFSSAFSFAPAVSCMRTSERRASAARRPPPISVKQDTTCFSDSIAGPVSWALSWILAIILCAMAWPSLRPWSWASERAFSADAKASPTSPFIS